MFDAYDSQAFFDELFDADGQPRAHYAATLERLNGFSRSEFERRRSLTDLAFRNSGITFTVYGDAAGTERTFPFDPVPRIIPAGEWAQLERGLTQRVLALNAFLRDVYGEQAILNDNVVPRDLVLSCPQFRREVFGLKLPLGVFTHIVGSDLVRNERGEYLVLEDNLRTPSGVSYVLGNRTALTRTMPGLFEGMGVRPVQHYTTALLELLRSLSPRDNPTVVVLTPGMYNSAYFEHSFLAQQMGVELVEGRDLFVSDGRVWMRTTEGKQRVDVIYRRIDDEYLDPTVFKADSSLGVRGLIEVYRQGHVALANAVGAGVADDKAVYAYVPKMIEYYLGEKPILKNVPTLLGWDPDDLEQMLKKPSELVFKAVGEAGGYGMLVGPAATQAEIDEYIKLVKANPRNYIAQPVIPLSRHPTYYPDSLRMEPCHVDLRPYLLVGENVTIIPGGLTRVALKRGSLVVNSSQGGGSKDTWVLEGDGVVAQSQSQSQGAQSQSQSQSQGIERQA